jgi:hypothetical protein
MADIHELKGFNSFEESGISDILLKNFVTFFDWGFVNSGGYQNINIPGSGIRGSDRSRLRSINDPNYANGSVWQSQRGNWVWETGLSKATPIAHSGVFVNGSLVTSGYRIRPESGEIVFNSPIATSSNVRLSYSTKSVFVTSADSTPWIRNIQRGPYENLNVRTSGEYAFLGPTRIQMPAVLIETVPARKQVPYQLGGGKEYYSDIIFNVIADSAPKCRDLLDKISYQQERTIQLFDPSEASASGVQIFDHNGFLSNSALPSGLYPNLVTNFQYKQCFIEQCGTPSFTEFSPNLTMGSIRMTTVVRG